MCLKYNVPIVCPVDEQGKMTAEAGERFKGLFDTLNNEIGSSVQNIETVRNITEQLGTIKDTIVSAVSDLSAVSEETSATNEEVTASATVVASNVSNVSASMGDVSNLSDQLKEAVGFFKV